MLLLGPRRGFLDASCLAFRVWPHDCDLNLHLNNGRFLTFMDLGRIHLIGQTKLLGALRRRRWMPVLGAAEISFIRPLSPLQKFKLESRLLGWDEKYFYMEQRFESRGRLCALATVKGLFVSRGKPVPNEDVVRLLGEGVQAPVLPALIKEWNELLALKKEQTTQERVP